jgi:hypothetical protein
LARVTNWRILRASLSSLVDCIFCRCLICIYDARKCEKKINES